MRLVSEERISERTNAGVWGHDTVYDLLCRHADTQPVSPEEIEKLILAHPKAAEVAVVGYPDLVQAEKVCAAVVARHSQSLDLGELNAFLKERAIARYRLPGKLLTLPGLPRIPVGKVLKREIRARIEGNE